MTDPTLTIDIGRIVLRDVGIAPERAGSIRDLVEAELTRLLGQAQWNGAPAGVVRPHLQAPAIDLPDPTSDAHLARQLAASVAQALRPAE